MCRRCPSRSTANTWIEDLLDDIVTRGREFGGGLLERAVTRLGPLRERGARVGGEPIVNAIDAWLDGDFGNPKPTPPPPTRRNIAEAAIDMENTALDSYKNTFDLLTNQGFLSSVFSNYGLLEAMGTSQFTYAAGDQITPAAVLKQNYDRSVWEQLLPQMFSWRLVNRPTIPPTTGRLTRSPTSPSSSLRVRMRNSGRRTAPSRLTTINSTGIDTT